MVDEHSSSEDMPYKFNGKELDEETGLYYYGARYMQPIASIWYGIDPLTEKYPDVSAYTYCMGNPVKLVDVDGRKVKPIGEIAFNLIQWGLSKEESSYIRLNKKGFIDVKYMEKGLKQIDKIGKNYESLLMLANCSETIEIIVANSIETSNGEKSMGNTSYISELDEMYQIECDEGLNISKEEYKGLHPLYSSEKEWNGTFGVSLYPDEGVQGVTINGNIQVVINNSPEKEGKEGLKKMTSTFAHEAYGHVLFKILGLPHSHGSIKSLTKDTPDNNIRLEQQIFERENESERNFNTRNN